MSLLAALSALVAASAAEPVELGKKVDHVVLRSVEGDVEVRVVKGLKRPEVRPDDRNPDRSCALKTEEDGRRATVSFGPKPLEEAICIMDFEVRVPDGVAVTVDLGKGTVDVADFGDALTVEVDDGLARFGDLAGATKVTVKRGDVQLGRPTGALEVSVEKGEVRGEPAGPVTVAVGEGHVVLDRLAGPVQVDSRVGKVTLTFAEVPPSPVVVNAGQGHISVDLPDGTAVKADLTTGGGTKVCDLPEGNDVEVRAVSSMGSIRVF